jgi:pyridoxamine 5'-phosphate oxidase
VTKTEIIEFLNANPTCYFATSEGNNPRVRALRMVRADEKGILFQTVEGKDLPKQLKDNPQVEICFYSAEKNVQVRVAGKATLIEDPALQKEILEQRPFLKPLVEKKGLSAIPVFRIVDCAACVWTMETNFAPKEYVKW